MIKFEIKKMEVGPKWKITQNRRWQKTEDDPKGKMNQNRSLLKIKNLKNMQPTIFYKIKKKMEIWWKEKGIIECEWRWNPSSHSVLDMQPTNCFAGIRCFKMSCYI